MIIIKTREGKIYRGEITGSDDETVILRYFSLDFSDKVEFISIKISDVVDLYID